LINKGYNVKNILNEIIFFITPNESKWDAKDANRQRATVYERCFFFIRFFASGGDKIKTRWGAGGIPFYFLNSF
jgi:hypothetical protein